MLADDIEQQVVGILGGAYHIDTMPDVALEHLELGGRELIALVDQGARQLDLAHILHQAHRTDDLQLILGQAEVPPERNQVN